MTATLIRNRYLKPPVGSVLDWTHPTTLGMRGCWLLNEGSGAVVNNIALPRRGIIKEFGAGNPWIGGNFVRMDGTGDRIDTGMDQEANFTGDFTVLARVRLTTSAAPLIAVGKYTDGNDDQEDYWLGTGAAGTATFSMRTSTTCAAAVSLNDGKWHTLVGVALGANHYLYFDGRLVAGPIAIPAGQTNPAGNLHIGSLGAYSVDQYRWNGDIDYVMLWGRAVQAGEARQLHSAPYEFIRTPSARRFYSFSSRGITFDAASNSGYQASASTYSWNHTISGDDRYLVVGVAMQSLAQTVSGITYGTAAGSQTFTGNGTFTWPAGIETATVEVWGAGGGAKGGGEDASGGGGGGGGYALKSVSRGSNTTETVVVGTAGTAGTDPAGNGGDGGESYFRDATTVRAAGGSGSTGTAGASGGAGTAGTTTFTGGTGGAGGTHTSQARGGGGGGSSAGTAANGNNGSNQSSGTGGPGGTAPTGGSVGGGGGTAANGNGNAPASGNGGGGGGGSNDQAGTGTAGGQGAGGKVVVTWSASQQNLTLIGTKASVSGACRVELWGLVAPALRTGTIAVTLTGAINSAGCASSFNGVHQTSPTEGFNSAQATNGGAADATVDVTTVADNDWCVDIVATDDTAITVGSGQTQRANVTGAAGSGAMSTEGPKTPGGAVTMSWTDIGASATWAIGSVGLRPVAAAAIGRATHNTRPYPLGVRVGIGFSMSG